VPGDEVTLGELSRQIVALTTAVTTRMDGFEKSMVRKDVWQPAQDRLEGRLRDLENNTVRADSYRKDSDAINKHFDKIDTAAEERDQTEAKNRFTLRTVGITAALALVGTIAGALLEAGHL
jgi:hypothetical protein